MPNGDDNYICPAGIAQLRREVEELRKDKARLDWIEKEMAGVEYNDRMAAFTVQRYQQVCGCIGDGRTVREAIDSARYDQTNQDKADGMAMEPRA